MDARKFAQIQVQMRENQTDVQDFLKGLDSWETDIKKKDDSLKTQEPEQDKDGSLPPVRNSLDKKKKRKKKKLKSDKRPDKVEKPKKKISGYDFQAWDKFDVDKACEEVDAGKSSSSSEYETDDEWEDHRRRQQAVMEKDQGNQYFKEGRYDAAIECYTRGIQCDITNPLLPANRAMALLKQNKCAAAEADAAVAIAIDPTYAKAYSRRGMARVGQRKWREAESDFKRVLSLEPGNKQARTELGKIDKKLNPGPLPEITEDSGLVKAIYKPPHLRSTKPMIRLKIEEIGTDEDDKRLKSIRQAESAQSATKRQITTTDMKSFEQFIGKQGNEPSTTIDCHSRNDTSDDLCSDDTQQNADSELIRESELRLHLKPEASAPTSCAVTQTCTTPPQKSSPRESSPRVPSPPQTSYQFQADWKILQKDNERFYQYLKAIDPEQYPKLFGQALDSGILNRILNTLLQYYVPANEDVYMQMKCLSAVKRFGMTVMFLSTAEKQVITQLMVYLRDTGHRSTAELDALAKTYTL